MGEDRRRQQLHLIGRRAAIGVFERHHLALLGGAETPANGAGRLRSDGVAGRRAAAADRAAAPMEKRDRDAFLDAHRREPRLRFVELPVRRQKAAVLIAVGIADHHLLQIALTLGAALDDRYPQQLAHDRRRVSQVGNGLEQRHDRQRAIDALRTLAHKPGFLGEHIGAQHIGRVMRHRQDETAEGLAVELALQFGDKLEHFDGVARLARKAFALLGAERRRLDLLVEPGAPLGRLGVRRRALAGRPPQVAKRAGGARRVLAQIEAHGGETENLDGAAQGAHEIGREPLRAALD